MALRQARGQFLAMLDADDWWYPEKLAEQMRVFEMRPSLALVSTGLAITNENDQIVGVRSLGKQSQKWPRSQMMVKPTVPRVAHAPSVLRMNLAQESGYDLNYSVAEDVDFLINILNGNEFTVVPRPLYAYSEAVSLDSKNIVNANKNVGKILGKYFRNYKFWIGKQIIENYLKGIAYRILFTTGLTDWTVARRSRKPDASESQGFVLARESVFGAVKRHWPGFVGVND
jgi:glycosyltransferase involved in cell wall biosynthesis